MKKKLLIALGMVLCAALLVVGSIAGTFAYLTSQDTVTNTFTVGKVKITMDESPVNLAGEVVAGDPVKKNDYKLMPGHTYTKNPTIHVEAGSENCWLFVEITDEIKAIQAPETIATQLAANGWTLVDGETDVYWHAVVAGGANVPVFTSFTILDNVENGALAGYAGKTISVTAYAVQEDGFGTAQAAWDATFGA